MEVSVRQTILPLAVTLLAAVCWSGWLIAFGACWKKRLACQLAAAYWFFLAGFSLLIFAVLLWIPAEYLLDWGIWLQIPGETIFTIEPVDRVNPASVLILTAVTCAALHSFFSPSPAASLSASPEATDSFKSRAQGENGAGDRMDAFCLISGVTAATLAALCDVPVLVVGWWSLLNVFWFLSQRERLLALRIGKISPAGADPERAETVRRRFLFRLAADGFLLAGLAYAATLPLPAGGEAEGGAVSSPEIGAAAWLLVLGLTGRCFAYPFFCPETASCPEKRFLHPGERETEACRSGNRLLPAIGFEGWFDCLIVSAMPAVLWGKLAVTGKLPGEILMSVSPLLLMTGGLLSVWASWSGGSPATARTLSPLLLTWVGLLLVGAATPHPHGQNGAVMLFFSGIVCWPRIASEEDLSSLQTSQEQHRPRKGNRMQYPLAAGLLLSGFAGTAAILSGLTISLEKAGLADSPPMPPANLLFAMLCVYAAHGRMSFVLVRRWRSPAELSRKKSPTVNSSPERDSPRNRPETERDQKGGEAHRLRTVMLVVLVAVLAAGQFLPGLWRQLPEGGTPAEGISSSSLDAGLDGWVVLLTLITGGIGGVLAWISPSFSPGWFLSSLLKRGKEEGGWLRQCRPDVFWMRFVIGTVQIMGQYCGVVQRSVSLLLCEAGKRVTESFAAAAEPLEENSVRQVALSLILATVLLLLAVGWGGGQ